MNLNNLNSKIKYKNVFGISLRTLVSLIIPVILIHFIFILNKTYGVGHSVSAEQFELVLKNVAPQNVIPLGLNAEQKYFGYFPSWIANIFYFIYLITVILAIVGINKKETAID